MKNAKVKKLANRPKLAMEQLEPRQLLAVDVVVAPFDHQQTFIGGGAGFGLYADHLVSGTAEAAREEAYDWLFEDLDMAYVRLAFQGEGESVNDNSDPYDLDMSAITFPQSGSQSAVFREAIERNPNTEIMAYAQDYPGYLRQTPGDLGSPLNTSYPNVYEEIAEWVYANLVNMKINEGLDVAVIDIFNEPDYKAWMDRATAEQILLNTIPALETIVDQNFSLYGVEMPLVSGPSNLDAGSALNWLEDWKANHPTVYDNVDILTYHPYGGGYNYNNHVEIANLMDSEHPLVIQNEMEFGHGSFLNNSNQLPADSTEDQLEGALNLGRIFTMSVNAGANAFHVFQGNSPQSGPKSLVYSPWGGTPERRKAYWAYKQLTSLQPEFSDVVDRSMNGAPDGFHSVVYNKWGDNQVYVNVTNATSSAETLNLEFRDNAGNLLEFNHIEAYSTSGSEDMAVILDQSVNPTTTTWSTSVPALSVQTYVVTLNTTGYVVPASELTYLRESTANAYNRTPQDGDSAPKNEFLVGLDGNGAEGTDRGEMRGLMEFDLSSISIAPGTVIDSARLELLGYRGSLGASDSLGLDVYQYDSDFTEALSTWADPDGDGSFVTGDLTQGGTLGTLLGSSTTINGSSSDYNADGDAEIFHDRFVVESTSQFVDAVSQLEDDLRLIVRPDLAVTTNSDFIGFFDEDSPFAPELIITAVQSDFSGPSVGQVTFNSDTNQSFDFIFAEDIDTSTLQTTDFVFTNLDTSGTLTGTDLFLINVTSTSASILFRELPLANGNWQLTIAQDAYTDPFGNGNAAFSYDFSVLNGDANSDGLVGGTDFMAWIRGVGTSYPDGTASTGDANHDLMVNGTDLLIVQSSYGTELPPVAAATSVQEVEMVTTSLSMSASSLVAQETEVETTSLNTTDDPLIVLEPEIVVATDTTFDEPAAVTTYPPINLAKLQTVTANSTGNSTAAEEAVDGVVSNESSWNSDSSGPHWLEVELTAPYPVGSAQLYLGYNDELTVGSFEIQYDEGFGWQTIVSITDNTATDLNIIFPEPIETATRYRFYTTESTARVKEFALLPPNGGLGHPLGTDVNLNLASLREPIVSSTNSSNHALRAVDGRVDDNSRWLSANNDGPHTIEAVLTTANEVGSIHLYTGVESEGTTVSVLSDFEIDYHNGTSWVPVPEGTTSSGNMNGNVVSGNLSSEVVVVFGAPVETTSIRITFTGVYGRFRELVILPANVTDSGDIGYPIGTSVEYEGRETQNFKDFHDSWYTLEVRSNGNSLLSSDTGTTETTFETEGEAAWYQLLYSYSLDAYRIRNKVTGKTLEVADASLEAGAAIVEGEYSAAPHQLWVLDATSNGYFQIVNVWSGMVLETDEGSPATITQQPQDTSSDPINTQEWDPVFQDDFFKKGTGGWVGSFGASWGYDWARNNKDGLSVDKFYAPMQHNAGWPNRGTLHKWYYDWNNDAKPAYLLGFNEPDRPDQADMTVSRAIELWPELMAMDIPLVSPAPSLGGEDWWLTDFMDRADGRGFRSEYAGGHWYSGPSVSNIFAHIDDVQNDANGRPVWLTEFSVVDWNNGSGDWSEETNYNFILEFLWRAETKNNLEKYAIFIFTGGTPTNPWDLTNPRSNFRFSNGTLTPFGKAYSSWDGETTISDGESYVIHNRQARHRLMNDGSNTLTQDTIRNEGESVQWYLEDAGNGRKYITSVADGQRLNLGFEGRVLNYAPAGTTGSDVEWIIQQDEYGWHNIIHGSSGQYLRLLRENNSSNAPVSLTFEVVTASEAAGLSSTDWWFVKPYNAVVPPNTSGPQVAEAIFNSNTDHSINISFSAQVDTATLEADDFVFENIDTGATFSGDGIFLLDVTSTSARIVFRERPLANGTWQMTALQESFFDFAGAGNPEFQMDFSVLNGDADSDMDVDGQDFMAWLRGFGTEYPEGTASQGDANHDLAVNGTDLEILLQTYGTGVSSPFISESTFNSNTDQSFDFIFGSEIDTATLDVSDFLFSNLTTGIALSSEDFYLVNVTANSATVLFRDLPLQNGEWILEIAEGGFQDLDGLDNPEYEYGFSVLNGDADGDNDVDGDDFMAWMRGYGTTAPDGTAENGDANHDLAVTGADLDIWQSSYGQGVEVASQIVAGDTDGDSDVDATDYLTWLRGLDTSSVEATAESGDTNNDQVVDGEDLDVILDHYGTAGIETVAIATSSSVELASESIAYETAPISLAESKTADLTDAALAWWSKQQMPRNKTGAFLKEEGFDLGEVPEVFENLKWNLDFRWSRAALFATVPRDERTEVLAEQYFEDLAETINEEDIDF